MNIQLVSYGAFLRLVTDGSVLMLSKTQIKSIEVLPNDTIRLNIGEGPLKEILIRFADVTLPSGLPDVVALRDAITHMLDYTNQYEVEALLKQQEQLNELIAIKQLFNLWHSSLQIDMNYQQLQVNALVAINDKLLKDQENTQRIIDNQRQQTDELKVHSTYLTGISAILETTRLLHETIISRQTDQTTELKVHTTVLTELHSVLNNMTAGQSDVLAELKSHTSKLVTLDIMETALDDIRTGQQSFITHQQTQNNLLADIKELLAHP